MSDPKLGMKFDDVEKRVRRINKNADSKAAKHLTESLLRQADLANKGASKELRRAMELDNRDRKHTKKYF